MAAITYKISTIHTKIFENSVTKRPISAIIELATNIIPATLVLDKLRTPPTIPPISCIIPITRITPPAALALFSLETDNKALTHDVHKKDGREKIAPHIPKIKGAIDF